MDVCPHCFFGGDITVQVALPSSMGCLGRGGGRRVCWSSSAAVYARTHSFAAGTIVDIILNFQYAVAAS